MRKCAFSFAMLALVGAAVLAQPSAVRAQETKAAPAAGTKEYRDKVIAAARQIMTAQQYCAFITVDEKGLPQVRTVNPFPPEEDMTVWFATGKQTRKVREIKANPNVAMYYADHAKATGYVQLSGKAVLVDDKAEIERHRRAYWTQAFPNDKNLVLVKIVPDRLDVIDYAAGVTADSVTWRSPSIELGPAKK